MRSARLSRFARAVSPAHRPHNSIDRTNGEEIGNAAGEALSRDTPPLHSPSRQNEQAIAFGPKNFA